MKKKREIHNVIRFKVFTFHSRLSIHPKYTSEFMHLSKVGLSLQLNPIFFKLKDKSLIGLHKPKIS